MPVRLRITILFTIVAIIILGIVCSGVFYFSSTSRIETIKTRLTNRAITTARLLEQSEIFNQQLIRLIDSSTTIAQKRKSVQAYRGSGEAIYYYSELEGDTVNIDEDALQNALENGISYFRSGPRDVVAYHDMDSNDDLVIICAAEDEDGKLNLLRLKKVLILCFIGGILISLAGGYIFSRQLLRPIKRITHEVKDISAYSLDRRIHTTNNQDEWHSLSATLNELLDRLKESFELQRRFISNASHELSTPLTLISTQLEISLQRHRTEEDYRLAMQTALQDVHNMSHLVQTLLKVASASGNAGGLNIEMVRIDEILMRLPGEIQKKDKEHRVSLIFGDLPEDENALLVLGNEELLFTAIRNLVTNACKYSPDHLAKVSLSLTGKKILVKVTDSGVGIDQKNIEKVFQPFFRVEETRSVGGFGLGLSLANQIIKLHKGAIRVESTVSQGSTFTIELPAAG
jgi:signal transduction histidine kinase